MLLREYDTRMSKKLLRSIIQPRVLNTHSCVLGMEETMEGKIKYLLFPRGFF